MAEYLTKTEHLTAVADAIRTKGGTSEPLVYPDGFVSAIQAIPSGGASGPVEPGDITFYDYEGTVVAAWTLAELAGKTALPDLPSHEGLICQGWNWSLSDLKTTNRKMNVGAMYITDDGKTRIYIHLEEGRTSPMLGCCPNGTVTVDWGDGTTPDTLTGTSTTAVKWTPNHAYAAPGDYVIKLTPSNRMGFYGTYQEDQYAGILRWTSGKDVRNQNYVNGVKKIELGGGVTSIGNYSFFNCYSLATVTIPAGVTSIDVNAFSGCRSLGSITIPVNITKIESSALSNCTSLKQAALPSGITKIGDSTFNSSYSLKRITLPDAVTSIGNNAFTACWPLNTVEIPDGVTSIGNYAFQQCYVLKEITLPVGITSIGMSTFHYCYSITKFTIPPGVTNIGLSAWSNCKGATTYDFSNHTSIPTLANKNAFEKIPDDCEIRVPAALVDEWKAATNWATYADQIVGV